MASHVAKGSVERIDKALRLGRGPRSSKALPSQLFGSTQRGFDFEAVELKPLEVRHAVARASHCRGGPDGATFSTCSFTLCFALAFKGAKRCART